MPYEGGHGYRGVLLFDGSSDRVQCHFCGSWEQNLPAHLWYSHKTKAMVYKKMVGLGKRTALISETIREKLIASGHEQRMNNLRPGKKLTAEQRKKIAKGLAEYYKTTEMQNVHGTCPLQLITKLRTLAEKLGRAPKHDEIPSYESYMKVFGSVKNALLRAGITPRKSGVNVTWRAGKQKNVGTIDQRYTRELVLGMVRDFMKEHGRDPSISDCRRGLLPSHSTFTTMFGGLRAAIRTANVTKE
jgi:hypothetical protein